MSEFSPEQDELASAYLDGAATIEEQALVESDPALLARVDELRSVRDALAEPVVPATAAERDATISAAVGATNVVAIDTARGQRRLRIASIAAAIVLVLGAAGILIRAAGSGSTKKFDAVAAAPG
jgi:arginine/ornithine N-succinyltransferase beta subunit